MKREAERHVETTIVDNPLLGLWAVFLDLSRKVEAGEIDLDEAMRRLRGHEAVDAFGRTWRVDPMTRSFIRRGPESDATWRPADPAEFGKRPEGSVAGPSESHSEEGAERPPGEGRGLHAVRNAIVCGAVVLLLIIAAGVWFGGRMAADGRSQGEPAPSQTASQQAPAVPQPPASPGASGTAKPYSVPPRARAISVLTEVSSGDINRIKGVTERSQYSYGGQRLHAAIYSGWANAGLTIDPLPPAGKPSGASAVQKWELRDGTTVVAVATVTWHRRDPASPWVLTEWPVFQPTG